MFKTVVLFLILVNQSAALASGSESSSGGNTREKDSSRDELRTSMRERMRANRLKEKGDQAEEKTQRDGKDDDSSKEEQ